VLPATGEISAVPGRLQQMSLVGPVIHEGDKEESQMFALLGLGRLGPQGVCQVSGRR